MTGTRGKGMDRDSRNGGRDAEPVGTRTATAATAHVLVPLAAPIAAEDQARADFYALSARLFTAPPDAALLAGIAAAPRLAPVVAEVNDAVHPAIASAWDDLRAASAAANPAEIAVEYDALFVGVGKCEVNLHASHWLTGTMMDRPLVDVRTTLAELGLAARSDATVVEDHLAALCEAMRLLVAGSGERPPAALSVQRAFFGKHLAPWVFDCCAAICLHPVANYYFRVAQFHTQLMAIERDAFAID